MLIFEKTSYWKWWSIYGGDMFQPSLRDGVVFWFHQSRQSIAGLSSFVPMGHFRLDKNGVTIALIGLWSFVPMGHFCLDKNGVTIASIEPLSFVPTGHFHHDKNGMTMTTAGLLSFVPLEQFSYNFWHYHFTSFMIARVTERYTFYDHPHTGA